MQPNGPVVTAPFTPVAVSTTTDPHPLSAALDQALTQTLQGVPADKRGNLAATVTLVGAQVSIAHKLTSNWVVGGWGGIDWTGNKSAGIRLTGAW